MRRFLSTRRVRLRRLVHVRAASAAPPSYKSAPVSAQPHLLPRAYPMQSYYHSFDPVADGVFALDLDDVHQHPILDNADLFDKPFDPAYGAVDMVSNADTFTFANWLTEPLDPAGPSAPIPIPSTSAPTVPDTPESPFRTDASFSPSSFSPYSDFAALPASPPAASPLFAHPSVYSPPAVSSVSPPETFNQHQWGEQFFVPSPPHLASPLSPSLPLPPLPGADDDYSVTQRRPIHRQRTTSVTQLFQSASAPAPSGLMLSRPHAQVNAHMPMLSRPYSRRAESVSFSNDDREATVRARRKRPSPADDPTFSVLAISPRAHAHARARNRPPRAPTLSRLFRFALLVRASADSSWFAAGTAPAKSLLRPPKLAPSAWQLYFTDWIQRHQETSTKKLNVAQAAKEAGQEYALLSAAEKEPYKRRSQMLKEQREREHAAYMRTLTPEDIKRENAFRTSQRKAGKSRKGNIKDPNAPKKPLSAYFMFLQAIRSDPGLVREVFGHETETTKQSVLAASKWRSMTDEERKPFLAQAEREKLEYETARKIYEEGSAASSPGYSNINFSILPGSPVSSAASIPRTFAAAPATSAPSIKVEAGEAEARLNREGATAATADGFSTFHSIPS
ncbi:hypothetical protein PUNSTDRAFT_132606 [Punctularia strigosozonata HHB-11173 SS5]|uniref:uncharacterized protein n=1 Tax=Punctularia strigosozonata (strain HHB-11173) TaxID=741275 RepID=UPI0004417321|nr:uncharacterized protein PUNSTDRAFT_132606 [Punctularia strigosozonata HHB-11173 SS5]EIN10516.1 hypothetical protein PUNSTDRAFT_132606 [Punctularia strigosozonata HHB-11173 SS5]